jgi:hypothetical protein
MDYTFNWSSLSSLYHYLTVGAVCPISSQGNSQTILVQKITITETVSAPPPPTFTATFSPTSVLCGSSTPVTFTAAGSNIPAGATVSYTWNLGANNGWLYNGSPAPATNNIWLINILRCYE